jgi:hypothetical protein
VVLADILETVVRQQARPADKYQLQAIAEAGEAEAEAEVVALAVPAIFTL